MKKFVILLLLICSSQAFAEDSKKSKTLAVDKLPKEEVSIKKVVSKLIRENIAPKFELEGGSIIYISGQISPEKKPSASIEVSIIW